MTDKMTSYIKKLLKYKEFLKHGVTSRIIAQSKSFFLGYFWWLFDPVINLAIYLFLVRIVFKNNDPQYVFYLAPAILAWSWFSSSVKSCCNIYKNNSNIIKNFYFPKIILPIQEVIYNTINFIISLVFLLGIYLLFGIKLDWHLSFVIIGILIQFLFTLGVCIFVSHVNVYVRDSEKFVNYGITIWFYLSPVLYSLQSIPEKFKLLFNLNPFTTIISIYRDALIFNHTPGIKRIIILLVCSIILIMIGTKIISKYEGDYAKRV